MGLNVKLHLFDQKIYENRLLPAYRAFMDKDNPDPLIKLLKEIIQRIDSGEKGLDSDIWDRESYEEDVGILNGSVYYDPEGDDDSGQGGEKTTRGAKEIFVRDHLSSKLFLALCIPRGEGEPAEIDMSNSALVPYLYKRSEWIKELFTFERTLRGGALELSAGESSELFTKEDIHEFGAALAKIPPPEDPKLRKDYDKLRTLLRLASEDSGLCLLLTIV